MLSLLSVPQCEPETFIYSNEVPALAYIFALVVSTLPLSRTSCWHPAPSITHSFIPDPWELRLHPALLTSPRVCFWVEGKISILNFEQEAIYPFYHVLAEVIYAQAGHSPLSVIPALWFFPGVALFWAWTWFRFKPEPPPWHGTCHLHTPLLYSEFLLQAVCSI